MGWLTDTREKVAAQAAKSPRPARAVSPRRPRPMVRVVFIQLRPQMNGDAGVAEEGWYIEEDGFVILTDPHGKPIGRVSRAPLIEGEGKSIAGRLLRAHLKEGKSDFNRVLAYDTGRSYA